MTTQTEVYALKSNTPWRDTPDPGPHRPIDPSLNTAGQNDAEVEFKFNKSVFDSEQNIKRAVIASLNKAVPKEYRRIPGGIGSREYRVTESPLDILNALRDEYGDLTPTERGNMEAQWAAPWNTSVPIESYFQRSKISTRWRWRTRQPTPKNR